MPLQFTESLIIDLWQWISEEKKQMINATNAKLFILFIQRLILVF